jgi:hypothetical protein
MRHSKLLIITAGSLGAIGAAGIGASAIAAASGSSASSYPPIVQKIASTFGLDPAKVNDVFQQQRQDNQQKRQAHLKSALDQAVKDGKLTQGQEDKLVAEIDSLRSQLKSENGSDRQQNFQDFKSKLSQWAKANGIMDLESILPQPPMGRHHGPGMGRSAGSPANS